MKTVFNATQLAEMSFAEVIKESLGKDIAQNKVRMSNRVRQKFAHAEAEKNVDFDVRELAKSNPDLAADIAKLIETNADEIMHTGNTGFGKENIPTEVWINQSLDLVPKYSRLLTMLPGDHGNNLPQKQTSIAIGDSPLAQGRSEWEDQASSPIGPDAAVAKIATAKVTIEQGAFKTSVALSLAELAYSSIDIEMIVRERLAASVGRTIDAYVLNQDAVTASTGNVNLDDSTPPSTSYYLQATSSTNGGLRKIGLSDAAHQVNIGTLAWDDFLAMMIKMGALASNPGDLLWIFNVQTFLKSLGLSEFKQAYQNGLASTIFKGEGAISNILGADIMTAKDFTLTEADGKISDTGANNTLGGVILLYKPAVQFGFGKINQMEVVQVAGKGIQLVVSFDFGFDVADQKAGVTDPSVVLGFNATV